MAGEFSRRTSAILISWLFCLSVLSCKDNSAKIQHSAAVPEGYKLAFHDEFGAIELDTAADGSSTWAPWWVGWNVRYLQGNGDKAWKCDVSYADSGTRSLDVNLHEITDSLTLRLLGLETPSDKLNIVNNFPFIGGMISANRSVSFLYGYFEIRCRFEASKGQHWALWLLPEDDSWPPEIDIVEVVGHQPTMVHMTAHWDSGNGHESNFQTFEDIQTWQYHVYAFEWTAQSMVWYLDGVEMKRMPNFVDKPMYVLISPEIGGNWTKMPDETTKWPTVCEIDYIRIYQKPNSKLQ